MNFKNTTWMQPVVCFLLSLFATTALTGCGGENSSDAPEASSTIPTPDPRADVSNEADASSAEHYSHDQPGAGGEAEKSVSRSSDQTELPDRWSGSNARPPRVLLSEKYSTTCLKNVGDSLAGLTFSRVAADATVTGPDTLESLLGSKLTVVVFCDLDFDESNEQVRRLDQEVSQIYREFGVASVAIHVGDVSTATDFASQLPHEIPLLVDTENTYQSVATMRPPRAFLLNSKGDIVWLDLEYSRGMRIELDNAIRFYLKQLFETAQSTSDASWR